MSEQLRAALESIAAWRKVNISGEYDHGLRDIIRSITDCAATALEVAMAIDFSTEAWRVLDRWCAEHDPDEELEGIFETVQAFHEWAAKNSVEKYLDANQPASSVTSQVQAPIENTGEIK